MPKASAESSPWKQREFILKAFVLLSTSHMRLSGFCSTEKVAQHGEVLRGEARLPGTPGNLACSHQNTKLLGLGLWWLSLCWDCCLV